MVAGKPWQGVVHCALMCMALPLAATAQESQTRATGALAIRRDDPFGLQDDRGRPLTLVGDYTWGTFSDHDFDYLRVFDSLQERGLNEARVWLWWGCQEFPQEKVGSEHVEPYLRPGPGQANDGRPKYDLSRFNPAFFDRLRTFCAAARERGIFLQLIAMDAWMLKHERLWKLHAYQRDNNINGVDGDPGRTGRGIDGRRGFCSMGNPQAFAFQKALIRQIVDTTNEFDNIDYEIANENYYNVEWERSLCDFVKEHERSKPRQHLTMPRDLPSHSDVVQKWDPLVVHRGLLEKRRLRQPLIFDTDWTINKNDDEVRKAMWSALASGGHFAYMDDSLEYRLGKPYRDPRAALHRQIDHAAAFVKASRPWEMAPNEDLVTEGNAYAMSSPAGLFAYLPRGGRVTLDLARLHGVLQARWYNPREGRIRPAAAVPLTARVTLEAPDGNDWALLIR